MSTNSHEHARVEAVVGMLAEIANKYPDAIDAGIEAFQARSETMRGKQWGKQDRAYCKRQATSKDIPPEFRITYYAKGYGERPPMLGGKGKYGYIQKDSSWDELFEAFPSDAKPESRKRQLRRVVKGAIDLKLLQPDSTPTRLIVASEEFSMGR